MNATQATTNTIVHIITSGDVGQARLWADAHSNDVARMSRNQRRAVAHACSRWGIPSILPAVAP